MEYTDLPRVADERTILLSFLVWQRETLARKCAGLSDDQLRLRTAEPSTLSLLGLVRHLADVERGWLQRTLGGHDVPFRFVADDDEDADFNGAATGDVREAFDAWREDCVEGDRIIAQHQLDDIVKHRTGREVSMRWILTHLVEEYSRHNGHADLLRERIDGATGY